MRGEGGKNRLRREAENHSKGFVAYLNHAQFFLYQSPKVFL